MKYDIDLYFSPSSSMQWSYSSCCRLSMTQYNTATTLPALSWEPTLMSWTMQVSETSPLNVTYLTCIGLEVLNEALFLNQHR